jgi:beta-galactosidase
MATTGALLSPPLRAAAMQSRSSAGLSAGPTRLDDGWAFRKGPVDGIWGVWRKEDDDQWQPQTLPHCFNALDACDPDEPYFRGQGWYRTRLTLANPFPAGRTLLHFQGAGQTSTLWVGSERIGTHKGGYDEFVFDITEAAGRLPTSQTRQGVPVAVLCENSPDLDRVASTAACTVTLISSTCLRWRWMQCMSCRWSARTAQPACRSRRGSTIPSPTPPRAR